MKSAIDHHNTHPGEPFVYVLTIDPDTPRAPSVVSWSYYKGLDDNAVSASHCQPDRGGDIYTLSISAYNILPPEQAHGIYKKKRIHKKTYKKHKKQTRKTHKSKKSKKTRKTKNLTK
jgi:hypothetical protein